MFTALDPVLQ